MSSTAANGTATTGDGTTGTVKATPVDNSAHEAIASWFLGPKAENTQYLRDAVDFIVSDMQKSRQNYHPEDMVCVQPFDIAALQQELITHRRAAVRDFGCPGLCTVPAEHDEAHKHFVLTFLVYGTTQHPILFSALPGAHAG